MKNLQNTYFEQEQSSNQKLTKHAARLEKELEDQVNQIITIQDEYAKSIEKLERASIKIVKLEENQYQLEDNIKELKKNEKESFFLIEILKKETEVLQ